MLRAIVLTVLLALFSIGHADNTRNGFYGGKEEGWFFYKDPKEMKRKELEVPPPSPEPEAPAAESAVKGEEVRPFSVKWLRENLDKLRDIALDDPSPENVRAYYYAQRVMLDKADKFATASREVVLSDPYLDENNNFPYASAARANLMRLQHDAKKAGLRSLSEKVGIWFFFDSKCAKCSMQVSVVNHLAKDYGFLVKGISLDGQGLAGLEVPFVRDRGQFRALNLSMTPTLVMAVPPKTFLILSQGVLSDESADDRILSVAATQKLLPPEISKEIDVFSNGILSSDDLNSEDAKGIGSDPKKWVEYLQTKLKAKY